MKKILALVFLVIFCVPMLAFAQDIPVADPTQFMEEIIALFKMVKAGQVGGIAIASAILALILQAFKLKILQKFLAKNKVLTLAITSTIGVSLTILTTMMAGMPFSSAIIAGLVTSGGAMALYSVWRAVFKKD